MDKLGPFITTLYESCSDEKEWKIVLDEYPDISNIIERWEVWEETIKAIAEIKHFPFTNQELDYLNSPFLDKVVLLNGFKPVNAFYFTCDNGFLEIAQWLYPIFTPIYHKNFRNNDRHNIFFRNLCRTPFLDIIKWIYELYPNIDPNYRGCFESACETGQLEVAKWLANTFNIQHRGKPYTITPPSTNRPRIVYWEEPLRNACARGHIEVVKWLSTTFPDINYHIFEEVCFRIVCGNGHLELAKWLKSTYPDINHRADNFSARKWALESNHPDMVSYLDSL